MGKSYQVRENIFVLPVDMENRSVWEKHPDLRFGQLVCDVVANETGRFYMEDDEMLEAFQTFAKEDEGS